MNSLVTVIQHLGAMPAGALMAIVVLGAMCFTYFLIKVVLDYLAQQGGKSE